jgi:paraquat-inducible protein A
MTGKAKKESLAAQFPKEGMVLYLVLFLAFGLFGIGVFAPILTFERLFIFSNRVSILSGLVELLSEGYFLLAVLIFLFSIVLPLLKMTFLFLLWRGDIGNREKHKKFLSWIGQYGKWSMLDVFVAAVLIVTIRLGAIAKVEVHYGLYSFAASVILTMFATSKVLKLTGNR